MADGTGAGIIAGCVATIVVGLSGIYAKSRFATKKDLDDVERRILNAITNGKNDHIALSDRLTRDEDKYLTKEMHEIVCSGNAARIENTIKDNMGKLYDEIRKLSSGGQNG